MTTLRLQAKRLKINLGIANKAKSLTLPQLIEKLQKDKVDLKNELDSARPNLPSVRR